MQANTELTQPDCGSQVYNSVYKSLCSMLLQVCNRVLTYPRSSADRVLCGPFSWTWRPGEHAGNWAQREMTLWFNLSTAVRNVMTQRVSGGTRPLNHGSVGRGGCEDFAQADRPPCHWSNHTSGCVRKGIRNMLCTAEIQVLKLVHELDFTLKYMDRIEAGIIQITDDNKHKYFHICILRHHTQTKVNCNLSWRHRTFYDYDWLTSNF